MNPTQHSQAPEFTGRLRPRYVRHVAVPPAVVAAHLQHALKQPDAPCCGSVTAHVGELCIGPEDRHTWSPKLGLRLTAEAHGTLLEGSYGPMPAVLTLVVFLYACAVALGIASAVYAGSMAMLGQHTAVGWGVPIAGGLIAAIYTASYIGQRLGHPQMDALHAFVEQVLTGVDTDPGR